MEGYGTMSQMEFDPHTIHQIIQRIHQQLRCPQCGKKVPVDWNAIRLTGEDFVLLQLKCDSCYAYIVLHAALQGIHAKEVREQVQQCMMNVSSIVAGQENAVEAVQKAIEGAGGSF